MAWAPVRQPFYCTILVEALCCEYFFPSALSSLLLSNEVTKKFKKFCRSNATHEESLAELVNDSFAYAILKTCIATLSLVVGIFAVDMFNYTALKQITRIRIRLFQSLIRQDIAWYDVSKETNFAVRITEWVEYKTVSLLFVIINRFYLPIASAGTWRKFEVALPRMWAICWVWSWPQCFAS